MYEDFINKGEVMAKVVQLGKGWWEMDRAKSKRGAPEPVKPVRKSIRDIEFWPVKKVAEKLNVTPQSVLEYIKNGKLEAQPAERGYLISVDAVDAYLENLRNRKRA
jgi:excisionase family DNA binding protein